MFSLNNLARKELRLYGTCPKFVHGFVVLVACLDTSRRDVACFSVVHMQ